MSSQVRDALARNVRAERVRRGLTQAALAGRLGWSSQKVGALETGARRLYADELPDLALALGVQLRDLLVGLPGEYAALWPER